MLRIGLLVFGAYQSGLAIFMAFDPGGFFDEIGAFGSRNDHYIRDLATFYTALGLSSLVASRHAAWRVPVLAFAVVQFALHVGNHIVDINEGDPARLGVTNAITLSATLIVLLVLLRLALRERGASK